VICITAVSASKEGEYELGKRSHATAVSTSGRKRGIGYEFS